MLRRSSGERRVRRQGWMDRDTVGIFHLRFPSVSCAAPLNCGGCPICRPARWQTTANSRVSRSSSPPMRDSAIVLSCEDDRLCRFKQLRSARARAGLARRYPSNMDRDSSRQRLHAVLLRDKLTGPGRPWRRLDVVEETGSTNADLLARAAAGENIDGAVLLAEYQSAGRGRHGRSWSTPPRSQIALSVGSASAPCPTRHGAGCPC